jgi:SEL1 protein
VLSQATAVISSHDQQPLGSQNDNSAQTAADKHAVESFLDVTAEQDSAAFSQPGTMSLLNIEAVAEELT